MNSRKYIFISGGVISGLGKGVTAASIGRLLESTGFSVTAIKVDMYLNLDAGTIRPQEHGEVFVTDDGLESDQDLGNYERFMNVNLGRANYITTGQVYQEVLRRERAFEYQGEDVEAIPHVTDEIIHRIKEAGRVQRAEIVIIEFGGTVGEYQNALFFEASRIMKFKTPADILQVHVAYLPIPVSLGEMKSKPVQQSVKLLNSMGIQPDMIVGRADAPIDKRRRERLALFCNVRPEDVISNPNVDSIYEVPLILEAQRVGEIILEKLGLKPRRHNLKDWRKLVASIQRVKREIKIAVVGKYFGTGDYTLSDSYISVIEAVKHGGWTQGIKPNMTWIDAERYETNPKLVQELNTYAGVIVPGGFGSRGVEGIITAIKFAREQKIPYLGLCYGMQLATVEFARHVAHLIGAHTTEIKKRPTHPVIHIIPEQEKKLLKFEYGGTMRLGAYPAKLKKDTRAEKIYGRGRVSERHRHRYELNNEYREILESAGLVISGASPDGRLAEIIELPGERHPFFIGTQFHPEFQSRPLSPHPLFTAFVTAAKKRQLVSLTADQLADPAL
ncbi:CTP synthase [Candidatus Berkelbacteria bacterium]|nr:CTP synthase [Candidatus Berkelbacteria bacterium]